MGKHSKKAITIVKASGEIEPFVEEKLRRSLRRSGTAPAVVDAVVGAVREQLYPGITTKALYRIAHRELKRAARPSAIRYSLKRAVMDLGPSGFPFERLVAAVLAADGWRTAVGVRLSGACVDHEVDVVADRGEERMLAECKYRNQAGYRTDVKVALYVSARSADLVKTAAGKHDAFWLVTNARFTADAIRYGRCAGLHLLGWDYPNRAGLQERLEEARLIPLTCLTTLSKREKTALLESGMVLSSDVSPRDLARIGASKATIERVLKEIQGLGDGAEDKAQRRRR